MKAQIQCRVNTSYLLSEIGSLQLRHLESDFGGLYAWETFETIAVARQKLKAIHASIGGHLEKDSLIVGKSVAYIVSDKSKFWHKEEEE